VAILPVFLVLWITNYSQWTVEWTLLVLVVSLVGGAVSGVIYWFVLTRQLVKYLETRR
jgi:hypothetical protein